MLESVTFRVEAPEVKVEAALPPLKITPVPVIKWVTGLKVKAPLPLFSKIPVEMTLLFAPSIAVRVPLVTVRALVTPSVKSLLSVYVPVGALTVNG